MMQEFEAAVREQEANKRVGYTQSEREQAALFLEKVQKKIGHLDSDLIKEQFDLSFWGALHTAIACLRSPSASPETDGKAGGWVRTSERMPTEEDAPTGIVVNAWSYAPMCGEYGFMVMPVKDVLNLGNPNDYWISVPALPALPEVEL